MQVDTITDKSGFDGIRDQWDELLASSRQDGPFLRFGWLRTWWDEYGGPGRRLHIIACRQGDRLVGVAPLYVTGAGRLVRADSARFLGDADVGSTGLSAFAEPDWEREVFDTIVSRLSWKSSGVDVLDLRYIDPDHGFFDAVSHGAEVRASEGCDCCPRIDLPNEWDAYLAGLSKHMRHEIRRSTRRVAERGFEFETVTRREDLETAIRDFHLLNEGRLKQKFGESFQVSEASRRFAARTMTDLFDEGRLRLSFIRDSDRRVAGLYQLRHGDTMYAVESGFCDDGRQDTQRALWGHTIRRAIEEGCSQLDMLLGDQRYKHDWGVTHLRPLSRLRAYRPTLAGALRNARDGIAEWLEERSMRQASPATTSTGSAA